MHRRRAAIAAVAIVLVVACGSITPAPVGETLADTRTLIADAIQQLQAATSYHMVVSYEEGTQVAVTADLRFLLPDQVTGTIVENGNSVNVLQTGGSMYVQGMDFLSEYGGSFDGTLFGQRWVLLTPDLLRTDVLDVSKLTELPSFFLNIASDHKRIDDVAAAADITAELSSTWGNLYITELPPHRLVKFESKNGFVTNSGFSSVNFELLEYNEAVDIQKPADVADINDPLTLPPEYVLNGQWKWGYCYYGISCGFNGSVVNDGGSHAGPGATYTFNLENANRRLLGQCGGAIRAVAHGKTVNIGCQVASAAYRSYTGTEVWGDLVIHNPAYDG